MRHISWLVAPIAVGSLAAGIAVAGTQTSETTPVMASFQASLVEQQERTCDSTHSEFRVRFEGSQTSSDPRLTGDLEAKIRSVVNTQTGWGRTAGTVTVREPGSGPPSSTVASSGCWSLMAAPRDSLAGAPWLGLTSLSLPTSMSSRTRRPVPSPVSSARTARAGRRRTRRSSQTRAVPGIGSTAVTTGATAITTGADDTTGTRTTRGATRSADASLPGFRPGRGVAGGRELADVGGDDSVEAPPSPRLARWAVGGPARAMSAGHRGARGELVETRHAAFSSMSKLVGTRGPSSPAGPRPVAAPAAGRAV